MKTSHTSIKRRLSRFIAIDDMPTVSEGDTRTLAFSGFSQYSESYVPGDNRAKYGYTPPVYLISIKYNEN